MRVLEFNQIGNDGTGALAEALPDSKVSELNLGYNLIGAVGARTLLPHALTKLNLMHNQIGYEGARALALVLSDSQITELNLWANQIGYEGRRVLEAEKPAGLKISY